MVDSWVINDQLSFSRSYSVAQSNYSFLSQECNNKSEEDTKLPYCLKMKIKNTANSSFAGFSYWRAEQP